MSNRDLVSGLNGKRAFGGAIATNTTTAGTAVSTIGYDKTMMFLIASAYTDGTYVLGFDESADGTTGWTAVPASNLIGAPASISSAQTLGTSNVAKLGCFGTKSFVRPSIVSTGVTAGATLSALVVQEANIQKTA